MDTVNVFSPGTGVKINGVEAVVDKVILGSQGVVNYELIIWNGNDRRIENVNDWEVTENHSEKTQVGFRG